MKYLVLSPYNLPLVCESREQAESALYLLECVGGFGQIVESPEEIDPKPVVFNPDAPIKVKNAVQPHPKPRGRPRSTK